VTIERKIRSFEKESSRDLFHVRLEPRELGLGSCLRLTGELDLATAPTLDHWVSLVERHGCMSLVFDLEGVTFMDASGLRAIIRAIESARLVDRTVYIVNAPPIVRRVMGITGTMDLLQVPSFPARHLHSVKTSV
jgi:anti-sigma B factor antagonist